MTRQIRVISSQFGALGTDSVENENKKQNFITRFFTNGGITRRWILGNLSLTVGVLIISVVVILLSMRSNLYSSARQAIEYRIDTTMKSVPSALSVGMAQRTSSVRDLVADFEEKTKFEMMLIDSRGNIVATSSGFGIDEKTMMPDYEQASRSEDGSGFYVGRVASREKVMAMTRYLDYPAGEVVAIRLVSSLRGIDARVRQIAYLLLLGFSVIVFFSIFSGLYFIRSIAIPIRRIGASASRIAGGDFDVRIEGGKHNDDLKWLSDTINNMASELSESDRMKNEFISSISHELRTPLTSIKGWGETLSAVGNADKTTFDKGIKIIIGETDRLSMLVEDLLDFSRMLNGVIVLNQKQIDFIGVLEDSLLLIEQRAKGLGIDISYSEPEYAAIVYADANRLKQVFVNILDNALKYSQRGGRISVSVGKGIRQVTVSIADEGAGIPPDEISKVTQRYYKASNSITGSGIGLAVVNEIVTLHSGSLRIESSVGKGTTVTVSIPLVENNRIR